MLDETNKENRAENIDPVHLPIENERLQQQVAFLVEIDQLKSIIRRSPLIDRSRFENSAEHSWHLSLAAMILTEYTDDAQLDLLHTIKLLLVHDLIEIDAGDTYCYDEAGRKNQKQREAAAADRIFSLLPADQGGDIRDYWEEFENRQTPEARFAHAVDRLMPLLHNYFARGRIWQENGIRRAQVEERMASIKPGSEYLHGVATAIIDASVRKGYLAE
jgi:putative hydrolase of HD superfamily